MAPRLVTPWGRRRVACTAMVRLGQDSLSELLFFQAGIHSPRLFATSKDVESALLFSQLLEWRGETQDCERERNEYDRNFSFRVSNP